MTRSGLICRGDVLRLTEPRSEIKALPIDFAVILRTLLTVDLGTFPNLGFFNAPSAKQDLIFSASQSLARENAMAVG